MDNSSRNQFGPEMAFIEEVPTVRDDGAVLKVEPGDCIVTARCSGNRWFVGGMNDEEPRQVKLSLSFLDTDTLHRAIIFTDVTGSRDAQRSAVDVTRDSVLDIAMASRGGLAVIIEPSTNR